MNITAYDRMIATAKLIASAKESDVFQFFQDKTKDDSYNTWVTVDIEDAAVIMMNAIQGYQVRIKPKPILRLKMAWEILRDCIDQGWNMNPYFDAIVKDTNIFLISDLIRQQHMPAINIINIFQMPKEWFEESEE